jgi:enoyl-CoA hydratase/carnithine racemase
VIAAPSNFCINGGLELAMACDLRIAAAGASFAITSAKIGTVAGAGGTQRLPRLVGPAKALELLFAAEPIDAAEALRIGLVNRVVPTGQALGEAMRLAQTYQARGPLSLAFAKQAVHRGMEMDLASGIELETLLVTAIYGTQDKQEGISAFLEKRTPIFRGA